MVVNGNFSAGWRDVQAPGLNLINQEPKGWRLSWIEPGQPLYDDPNSVSRGVPECVHKLDTQLPANEQLGAEKALILAGEATYKMFSATAPFGTTLSQTVTGLKPGTQATLTAPVQVHLHGETDPFGAESGVWVNGEGGWVNGHAMGDRQWHEHKVTFTVPDSGEAEIIIRVKSKWFSPKDFFIDGVELAGETAVSTPPGEEVDTQPPDDTPVTRTVFIQLPSGVELRQGTVAETNVIEVNVGPGVKIEVV